MNYAAAVSRHPPNEYTFLISALDYVISFPRNTYSEYQLSSDEFARGQHYMEDIDRKKIPKQNKKKVDPKKEKKQTKWEEKWKKENTKK